MSSEIDMEEPATPVIPVNGIGEWIAAYARGEVRDQNAVLLDRLIKDRVAQQKPIRPQRPIPAAALDENEVINRFVNAYARGTASGPARDQLDAIILERSEGISVSATVEDERVTALSERMAELEMQIERLEAECVRAHDWRFHLESRAREAHAIVDNVLRVTKRPPTVAEMETIRTLLKEAIGWAPR